MLIPAIKREIARFNIGDCAELVHLPHRTGQEIRIPVTVRQVVRDGYVVDTENQKGINVDRKALRLTETSFGEFDRI
ncbi:hypothetical protein DYBT9623_04456 [Dyadobacter sp. CECT 9623]|uniref:Uncharacterized protein n=1 Tax=Dyadobacter linearis TaxID=2823330 RepID=A0ABN7RCG7_9BACT|nr:hypothetical protein DYBT9623_04456 [Dyadobacter sp. CECT 9623]